MSNEQKELLTKLLKASQEIGRASKDNNANYIHLSVEYIQSRADENGVTFDEMIEIIENELKPKQQKVMNFGTNGCMYNCGDSCTGECNEPIPAPKQKKKNKQQELKFDKETADELYQQMKSECELPVALLTYTYRDFDGVLHPYASIPINFRDSDEINIEKMEKVKSKYGEFFMFFNNSKEGREFWKNNPITITQKQQKVMISRRVRVQAQLSKELIEEQMLVMGAEQLSYALNRQLIELWVNEMLSTRLQDLKTEQIIDPDGKSSIQMKLDLFVFNQEELNGLVAFIKNGQDII